MEQRETNHGRGGLDVQKTLEMISTLDFWIGGASGKWGFHDQSDLTAAFCTGQEVTYSWEAQEMKTGVIKKR